MPKLRELVMTKICSAFLTAQFPTCDLISLSSHLFCIGFHCCLNHFYDAHGFHSILTFLLVEMSAQWRARGIGHWLEHEVLFEHQEALLCCASDWNSWPGEAVDSPPWRSCLDVVVGSVLWVSLLEQWLHRDPELPSELIHLWLLWLLAQVLWGKRCLLPHKIKKLGAFKCWDAEKLYTQCCLTARRK